MPDLTTIVKFTTRNTINKHIYFTQINMDRPPEIIVRQKIPVKVSVRTTSSGTVQPDSPTRIVTIPFILLPASFAKIGPRPTVSPAKIVRPASPAKIVRPASPAKISLRPIAQRSLQRKSVYGEKPVDVVESGGISSISLKKIENKWIGLDQISCGNIRKLSFDIFESVEEQGFLTCSNYGQKITNSMIRVAATRIFADPSQSIMELLANSIDSYRKDSSIGKFGMGFFSILYWLIGYPKRTLEIISTFADSAGLHTWKGIIKAEEDDMFFILKPTKQEKNTGTTVTLNLGKEFNNPSGFYGQINKLADIHDVSIKINRRGQNFSLDNKVKGIVEVTVKVSESISVSDNAGGISYKVLFGSLLTPSISTKTINASLSQKEPFVNRSRTFQIPWSIPIFNITVGDVAVVSLKGLKVGDNYVNKSSADYYILSLPGDTQVPVSRDDIIAEQGSVTEKLFRVSLEILIEDVINKLGNLTELFSFLDRYSKYTGQISIQTVIADTIQRTLDRDDLFLVPDMGSVSKSLGKLLPTYRLVQVPNVPIVITEKKLTEALTGKYREDIYMAKKIIILDTDQPITNGGLPSFLFISKKYTEDHVNWVSNLAGAYSSERLYLNDTKVSDAHLREMSIASVVELNEELLVPLSLAIKASMDNFNQFWTKVYSVVLQSIAYYFQNSDRQTTKNYISRIYSFFSGLQGEVVYGISPKFIMDRASDFDSIRLIIVLSFPTPFNKELFDNSKNVVVKSNVVEAMDFALSMSEKTRYGNVFYNIDGSLFSYENNAHFPKNMAGSIIAFAMRYRHFFIEGLVFLIVLSRHYASRRQPYTNYAMHFLLNEIRGKFPVDVLEGYFKPHTTEILYKVYLPLLYSLDAYIELAKKIVFVSMVRKIKHKSDPFTFTARQLIDYIYSNNIDDSNLAWIIGAAGHNSSEQKLQTVEIAVNEGTTKGFIQSVLTELVQNSVDATNLAIADGRMELKDTPIEVNTGDFSSKKAISVTDFVGMPNKGILAVLVPFLSTKSAKDMITTGEMGSGFFNVYRQPWVKEVYIETTNNVQSISIIAEPTLLQQRVVDINYKVSISPKSTEVGTKITIILNDLDNELVASTFTDVAIFSRNSLGLIKFPITLNSETMNWNPTETYNEPGKGSFSFESKTSFISTIMTNGVPFMEMKSYLDTAEIIPDFLPGILPIGLKINLDRGFYTPVQSRNKIFIDEKKRQDLRRFLMNGFYYTILYCLIHNQVEGNVLYGWNSTQSCEQLRPANIGLDFESNLAKSTFMMNYKPEDGTKSLSSIICSVMDNIRGEKMTLELLEKEIKSQMQGWKNLPLYLKIRKIDVLSTWFFVKIDSTNETLARNSIPQKGPAPAAAATATVTKIPYKREIKKLSNKVTGFFHSFMEHFWKIGESLKIKGTNFTSMPKIEFFTENIPSGVAGSYSPAENFVQILADFQERELENSLGKLYKQYVDKSEDVGTFIKEDHVLKKFFNTTVPSTTLIHEISHAWRRDSHEGPHQNITLEINGTQTDYTFDQAATEIYKTILLNGLMRKYWRIIRVFKIETRTKILVLVKEWVKQKVFLLTILAHLARKRRNVGMYS